MQFGPFKKSVDFKIWLYQNAKTTFECLALNNEKEQLTNHCIPLKKSWTNPLDTPGIV